MLEDRRLLATINVTSAADDGSANTLRWAIGVANIADTPTSIDIELGASPAMITLELGELDLTNTSQPITIYDGAGQGPVSISGDDESGIFDIGENVTATLSGLTITGGSTQGNGGGLYNGGSLTLMDCTISGNSAFAGGAVYNSGQLSLTDCTISGNSGAGSGGGLFNLGDASLDGCALNGNSTSGASGGKGGVNGTGYGNSGSGLGGGIFNHGTVQLISCTVSGNNSVGAPALFNYGSAILLACTVVNNYNTMGGPEEGSIFIYDDPDTASSLEITDTLADNADGTNPLTGDTEGGAATPPVTGSNDLVVVGPVGAAHQATTAG